MSNNLLRLIVSFAAIDKLSGPLKNIVGLAQSGGERLAGMKRQARDLDRELRDVQGQIARHDGFGSVGLRDRQAELEAQLARTNRQIERQAYLLRVNATADRMRARGDALISSGQQNIIAGGAMAAPLFLAAKAGMDFEKQLALIAQKTDLSEAATARLGQRVLQVAGATSQANNSLLEAVDFLSGKGVAIGAIDKMLPAIGKFATAWDADVVDASKAAYAGFLSLKVPLDQTARSLEVMAAAGKAGGFEVKDMAQFFPQLTSNLSTFGAKGVTAVADLSAALQVLEAKTGDGSMAANDLANLLTFTQSNQGMKNFKKLGIDVFGSMQKAAAEGRSPILELIGLLNKATGGNVGKVKQIVTDTQAGRAAVGLMTSQKRYEQIKAEALASLGMTEKEYQRLSKTSAANWTQAQSSLGALAITAGTHLLPALTASFKWITRTINGITAWARANPAAARTLLYLLGAIASLRIGLGALQIVTGVSLKGWAGLFRFLATNGPAIAGIFGGIRTAALFLGRGMLRAGAMMLANPIVLIIAGIVAALGVAGYLIYTHWDTIKAAFWGGVARIGAALEWAKQALGAGLAWLSGLPQRFLAMGAAMLDGLVSGITSRLDAVRKAIVGAGEKAVGWFKNLLGIKSPSRVFMGMGGNIAAGLALGIANGQGAAAMAAQRMADRVAAVQPSVPIAAIAAGAKRGAAQADGALDRPAPFADLDLVPMAPARKPRGAAPLQFGGAGGGFRPVTITINAAPGQSEKAIAEEVRKILEDMAGEKAAARRSTFRDDED